MAELSDKLQSELDAVASALSHELRAPLRAILTLSEFIVEDLRDVEGVEEDTFENLGLVRQRIRRMDESLVSLVEYLRVGRQPAKVELVDIEAVVREAFRVMDADAARLEVFSDAPTIHTARALLERVVAHLLDNTVKHHLRGDPAIEVRITQRDDMIEILFEDDGPGIANDHREKVWALFATLKRRDEVEGSGMGLPLVRKIAEHAGGSVEIIGESPGCTVRVRWPMRWPHS